MVNLEIQPVDVDNNNHLQYWYMPLLLCRGSYPYPNCSEDFNTDIIPRKSIPESRELQIENADQEG